MAFPTLLNRRSPTAFTLIEMLVATTVLALVIMVASSLMAAITSSHRSLSGTISQFENARVAFDLLKRTLSQATLNSYIGYDDPTHPTRYERQSDLHFITGANTDLDLPKAGAEDPSAVFFQAPVGMTDSANLEASGGLLCSVGFYLSFGGEPKRPPHVEQELAPRKRFRLMYFIEPSEKLSIYGQTLETGAEPVRRNASFSGTDWFSNTAKLAACSHVLAENVVALKIVPIVNGQPFPGKIYNSRDSSSSAANRLPQALKVMIAVIDESSAITMDPDNLPTLVPGTLFLDSGKFDADVSELEKHLAGLTPRLNFRIFTAEIPIQAAEWNL